jgi:hypothetical protein
MSSPYLNNKPKQESICVRPPKAFPVAFVPPMSVGANYTPPTASFPIGQPKPTTQITTARPSYLNIISNSEPDHPLAFMAYSNTRQ